MIIAWGSNLKTGIGKLQITYISWLLGHGAYISTSVFLVLINKRPTSDRQWNREHHGTKCSLYLVRHSAACSYVVVVTLNVTGQSSYNNFGPQLIWRQNTHSVKIPTSPPENISHPSSVHDLVVTKWLCIKYLLGNTKRVISTHWRNPQQQNNIHFFIFVLKAAFKLVF